MEILIPLFLPPGLPENFQVCNISPCSLILCKCQSKIRLIAFSLCILPDISFPSCGVNINFFHSFPLSSEISPKVFEPSWLWIWDRVGRDAVCCQSHKSEKYIFKNVQICSISKVLVGYNIMVFISTAYNHVTWDLCCNSIVLWIKNKCRLIQYSHMFCEVCRLHLLCAGLHI